MTDLDPTLVIAKQIAPRLTRAVRNAADGRDGYPTGSSGSGGTSDRTGTLATKHVDRPDRAAADHAEMSRLIRRLASLVDSWAPNNAAADHLANSTEDRCPQGWCESCWRNNGHHSPTKNPGGRFCRWCEETARTLGMDLPPILLVRMRNEGRRITDRDVRLATGGKS